MTKWTKITKDTLPEFDTLVLLLEPSVHEHNYYCYLGSLVSVNKDGPVFKLQNQGQTVEMFADIFGSFEKVGPEKVFKFWAPVDLTELPND